MFTITETHKPIHTLSRDKLQVQITFAPSLNRFIVNPRTNCLHAETYPDAVAIAEEMLGNPDNVIDTICIHPHRPPQIQVSQEKLFKVSQGYAGRTAIDNGTGETVSYSGQLPTEYDNRLYLQHNVQTALTVERNATLFNLVLATLIDPQRLIDPTLNPLPILNFLVSLSIAQLPTDDPKSHYAYTDAHFNGGNHRAFDVYHASARLLMVWCLHVLQTACTFGISNYTLVFLDDSYDQERRCAKQVAQLYRQIVTHLQRHPDDLPVGFENGSVTYTTATGITSPLNDEA